jgi:uncharacterized protein YjiS (DUF1127 family)
MEGAMNHATRPLPLHRLSDFGCFAIIFGARRAGACAIGAWRHLARLHERSRQRRALARLDDRLLRDVGITRYEAEWECRKPFWQ